MLPRTSCGRHSGSAGEADEPDHYRHRQPADPDVSAGESVQYWQHSVLRRCHEGGSDYQRRIVVVSRFTLTISFHTIQASGTAGSLILGLLGVVLTNLNVLVGSDCSPITVIGIANGQCASNPVCCDQNSWVSAQRVVRL